MTTPFLDSYGGQTTEELLALEGRYRIDSLVLAFEQAIQQKTQPSPDESYILAVEGLEREVNNGGFSQFFLNSSGEFAPIIERALRAIGCPRTADIARDAVTALSIDGALSADAVSNAVSADDREVERQLGECDDRYFANDEPIADRLFEWIKAHTATIRVGDR
jgi:hypothetical protein